VTDKESKLVEDEEAATAADEPMGSVAAAVPRDEGSSADKLKKPHPPKLGKPFKPARP